MPRGCETRFRGIQGARDEITHQGAWSRSDGAGPSRRRRRPRWSYEMPNARHPDDDWGEFWGAEERKRKGYEAEAGQHWYDRAEERSDIDQHVVLLGCAAAGLAILAGLTFAEARSTPPRLLRAAEPPATRKLMFTAEEEGARSRPRRSSGGVVPGAPGLER